jgi:nuclease S1
MRACWKSKCARSTVALAFVLATASLEGWGPQGHRIVATVAANHLTPVARQNVEWLLGDESLASVSVWADTYLEGNNQTSFWHYVNIPADARRYDRDRDCPRQPGVSAGRRGDAWRDCVVDRIRYNEERLASRSLDRADRAIALKFLVHLIGDLHQPFHALGVERGGNGIPVRVFGSSRCGYDDGSRFDCNMHALWDSELIAHRKLNDRAYVAELERQIKARRWVASGSAAEWAMESHALAKAALLARGGEADEAYYRKHIGAIEERLALGGLRLAAVLNQALR